MLIVLAMIVVALCSAPGWAETNVLNIRHWAAPDHTRVVIDTSNEARYRVVKQDMLLSVEIDNAQYVNTRPRAIDIKKPGIEKIAVSIPTKGRVLVDLHLRAHTETKVFRVKRFEDKPDRIVIDIILPEVARKEREDRERVKEYTKDKVVVIDPGHGGEDPGAIGRQGTQEKKVVLEIARKVRDKLNAREGYYAFLTREGDYYVSFRNRLKIAREYGADLFLSIHADGARSKQACGSSVYVLSLRGASNEAARILARNENLADIMGGVGNGEGANDESDPIILNMFQTQTLNSSKSLGNLLLKNMAAVNRIKFSTVQEAPFMVLKLPEVPSILIETAYITNPAEEKKLRKRKFQDAIATVIAESAVEFLSSAPPPTLPIVVARRDSDTPAPSRVVPGGEEDIRKETTEQSAPISQEEEGGKETPSQTEHSQKLKKAEASQPEAAGGEAISSREEAPAPRPAASEEERKPVSKEVKRAAVKRPPVFHMVKRGESVERIAKKYRVSPLVILKANNMEPQDPLYVNRKIVIPSREKGRPDRGKGRADRGKKPVGDAGDGLASYVVVRGDSLDGIARRHGTTYLALMKLNGMKVKDTLYAGKKIKVPLPAASKDGDKETGQGRKAPEKGTSAATPARYRVKNGDTLEAIAARHGTTLTALLKLNGMKARDTLYAGKVIVLRELAADDEKGVKKADKRSKQGKKKDAVYIVKKGDSLDAIARRHRTTVGVIKEMNAGQRLSPLYVNQRLKIPGAAKM